MFKKIKANLSAQRLIEEELYAQISAEISDGVIREGLWIKATANAGGNESKTKALYIKYRVQSIHDEANVLDNVDKITSDDINTLDGNIIHIKKYYVFKGQFDVQLYPDLTFIENNGRGDIAYGKCELTSP